MERGLLVELRPNEATLRLVIEVETACAMVTSFVMGRLGPLRACRRSKMITCPATD
jgi:hypothetical protein